MFSGRAVARRCVAPGEEGPALPRSSRWLVRAALVHLVAAMLLAWGEAAARAGLLPAEIRLARPVWIHLLAVGWLSQLAFGVALWMFPRPRDGRPASETSLLAAWFALNLGLLVRAVAEPAWSLRGARIWGLCLVASGLMQWVAMAWVVRALWPRVRGR